MATWAPGASELYVNARLAGPCQRIARASQFRSCLELLRQSYPPRFPGLLGYQYSSVSPMRGPPLTHTHHYLEKSIDTLLHSWRLVTLCTHVLLRFRIILNLKQGKSGRKVIFPTSLHSLIGWKGKFCCSRQLLLFITTHKYNFRSCNFKVSGCEYITSHLHSQF